MSNERIVRDGDEFPENPEMLSPISKKEFDLSQAEKRWALTLRRSSVQRKNAQHTRQMPSRTLAGLVKEKSNERHRTATALAYATMRAHRSPNTLNIVSHIEQTDELMLDDPISEQLRLDRLRDIPHCLTVKRSIKAQLTLSVNENKKRKPIGFWKRLKYRISMSFTKIGMAMRELTSSMEIWYHWIKAIEGHFGSGVATYFKFLRWLFTFNIICCVLSVGFIVFPQSLLEVYSANETFSGWDLLLGNGFFTNTIMYYGFYTNGTVSLGSGPLYSMPAAYFMTLLCCYVFIFLLLSIRVARSYRKSFIETAGGLTNVYASKIFCGWDFGIASYRAANLRSATIYGELKELLGESQKRSHQNCATRCYTLFLQIAMTILVLTIMAGTGVLLWTLLTHYSAVDNIGFLMLVIPVSITIVMNLYPAFFSWLVQFEGYASKRTALYVTMIRTWVMEVVVLGVLLSYWLMRTNVNCWQTAFPQEIYRLIIVDFIVSIVGIFIAQMIRSKLYLSSCKKMGAPRFDIARNTLNLIYNQTLFWVAFYFSPLMSVVIIVKFILTFYIKTYGVLNHCEPPSRSWRAAQTQTLFLALAFLSMVGVLFVIGYVVTSVHILDCGPFQGYEYTWEMVIQGVLQLRSDSQFWVIVTGLAKPGVIAGILIAMCVAVYYQRAKAYSRQEMVQILKGMLVLEAQDKEFLLNGISKVTDEQWLSHLNPLLTRRPSVFNNSQQQNVLDSPRSHRHYNDLNSDTPRPSASSTSYQKSSNPLPSSMFSRKNHNNSDRRYDRPMEMSEWDGIYSDTSSTHNSIKSQDAKEGVVHQYNFMY